MYTQSAELYDLLYSGFKDYPAEAEQLAARIRRLHPEARTVLDVACGTGEHARLLRERHGFQVDGFDLDPAQVRIAAAKNPGGDFRVADMMDFSLPQTYDVVTCLFSSIGYVRTPANVRRALTAFRRHLAGNGLVVVEPWFPPGVLQEGRIMVATAEGPGVKVCRMSHMTVEGRTSTIHFQYLIGRAEGISRAGEAHELGLFTEEEMAHCFQAVGLAATFEPGGLSGRGLWLARPDGVPVAHPEAQQ